VDKNEILKKVIAKLEEMKEDLKKELEEKTAAILDQDILNDFVLKFKILKDPEKVKKLVTQFDFINNTEKKQAPRLELLNKIKKEDLFRFKEIKGMREMLRKLVNQEWEISSYLFGEL